MRQRVNLNVTLAANGELQVTDCVCVVLQVSELMGTVVVQTVCGRRHLVVVTEAGRLQSCGGAGAGQLGLGPAAPGTVCVTQPRTITPAWQVIHNNLLA